MDLGLDGQLVRTLATSAWAFVIALAAVRLGIGLFRRQTSWYLAAGALALAAGARALLAHGMQLGSADLGEAVMFALVLAASFRSGSARKAEAAWLQENSFKTLAENIPAVFVVKDLERRYVYVNGMFLRWYATTVGKVLGRTRREIAAPYSSPEDEALETRVLEEGAPRSIEVRQSFPDGTRRNTLIVKFPITVPDGEIRYLGGFSLDVTEHRQALEALKRSERRYRSVVDNVTDGVFVLDGELRVVEVNSAACEAFGYRRKEMLSGSAPAIGDPVLLREALVDGRPRRITRDLERKDGTTFPAEIALGSGEWDGRTMLVATVRDVSERHRILEELYRSESWLRAIVENMPAEIYLKNLDFHYVFVNRRLGQLFGVSPETFVGKTVHDLHSGETAQLAEAMDRKVVETSQAVTYEDHNTYPHGSSRTILAIKFPIVDPTGAVSGIGGINIDISDRKQAERALRDAKE
jgi:two-component system NtrC family sensor kinase